MPLSACEALLIDPLCARASQWKPCGKNSAARPACRVCTRGWRIGMASGIIGEGTPAFGLLVSREATPACKRTIMNVLLTGANGMLAADVKQRKPAHVSLIETDVGELDITDRAAVARFFADTAPDAVLNCAAYTAVDQAETDRAAAFAVNETGPANLAQVCAARRIPLVHVSTDFVFNGDGSHPLTENDPPAPRGVYAESKHAGELAIERAGGNWLVVRTAWLYGLRGKCFPDTIIRLATERDVLTVVNDQQGSPTYSGDLAEALWRLMGLGARGHVHFANAGICTWYEFAKEIVEHARNLGILARDNSTEVKPVTSEEFRRPAPRPAYSALSTARYAALVGTMPRLWREALREYLEQRRAANR